MTVVLIGRASNTPEVGPLSHYPADGVGMVRGVTVRPVACGLSLIGQAFDREDGATCALCRAVTGEHPGQKGKRYLSRLHRAGELR